MKILADGFIVSARSYYYLLDWNEMDEWRYINEKFGKSRLNDLTREEYKELFETAIKEELKRI